MSEIAISIVKLFGVITLRYFLFSGFFFILFYLLLSKKLKSYKIQNPQATKKDFFREIFYSTQSNLVFVVISAFLFLTPIQQYTQVYIDINAMPMGYFFLSIVLALVIHDTYFYWMHKTLHTKCLYKTMHKVHHLSTNPSPWAAFSFHFTEAFFEGLVIVPIVFILPMHPLAILSFTVASLVINIYGHLGYEIMPKWFRNSFLFQIFNSSVHHNMHHQHFNSNFGLYFRVWDRIMGTEHPEYEKEFDRLMEIRLRSASSSRDA